MTVSKRPPGRGSTVIPSSGVLTPIGPQKWVKCEGVVMHSKTTSGRASKIRVMVSSPSWVGASLMFSFSLLL